jgi:hypothetical protein
MPTSPTPITELPAAPNPDDDESVFDNSAYAWSASLPNFRLQANAIASVTYGNAQEAVNAAGAAATSADYAEAKATTATTQAGIATTKAGEAADSASTASTAAGNASDSATDAADSAAAAAVSATSLTAISATSTAVNTGDKVFVIGTGKQFPDGEAVAITSKGAPTARMFGAVKSYVGPDLTVTVDGVEGAGTHADWVIGPGGQRGQQGIQGLTGGVNGGSLVGQLVELKAANIASAATVNVWAAAGNSATLSGATAVTSFGTAPQAGAKFTLIAGAATPVTNGANLALPGGVDYTTTAGDRLEIFAETATKMVVSIFKSDGTPVIGGVTYSARTSNVVLTRADTGKFIDITSGTFTQTFDTLSNLPAGWAVWIRNSGSGDITIPASDGRTNWIMYTGETRLFMKDQAAGVLKTDVLKGFDRAFTTSTTFIKPPGYLEFEGELWSGGNGGKGGYGGTPTNGSGNGGPGAAGANWAAFSIPAGLVSDTESVVIGGGGAPGTAGVSGSPGGAGGSGGAGGISSLGPLISSTSGQGAFVTGGAGGAEGTSGNAPTNGSAAGKGGGGGGGGGKTSSGGGPVVAGAAGGVSTLAGAGGAGGASSNTDGVSGSAGSAGVAPGGGGGGGGGGYSSGNGGPGGVGARGEVRVRGVA